MDFVCVHPSFPPANLVDVPVYPQCVLGWDTLRICQNDSLFCVNDAGCLTGLQVRVLILRFWAIGWKHWFFCLLNQIQIFTFSFRSSHTCMDLLSEEGLSICSCSTLPHPWAKSSSLYLTCLSIQLLQLALITKYMLISYSLLSSVSSKLQPPSF